MIDDARLEKKEKVLQYLQGLPVYKWAAAYAGINQDTLKDWRDADPDFSERCESVRSEAISKLGKRASPDFILTSIDGETFGRKDKVEHSGGVELRWNDANNNTIPTNATPETATPDNK